MSNSSEQILILYDSGVSPSEIAEQLSYDVADVLLILNSTGRLSKKNIKGNIKLQAIITKALDKVDGVCNEAPYVSPKDEKINQLEIDNENETVEQIYEKHQKRIARKMCEIAISDPDESIPASVIIKAGIYAREEATGRNEARSKRSSNNDTLLQTIAQLMRQSKIADAHVMNALEIGNTNGESVGMKMLKSA